jgi:hypothetical protein
MCGVRESELLVMLVILFANVLQGIFRKDIEQLKANGWERKQKRKTRNYYQIIQTIFRGKINWMYLFSMDIIEKKHIQESLQINLQLNPKFKEKC